MSNSDDDLKSIRRSAAVERNLMQFRRYAAQGDSREYKARYDYTFDMSPDRRASIDALMGQGLSFLEAYDAASNRTP